MSDDHHLPAKEHHDRIGRIEDDLNHLKPRVASLAANVDHIRQTVDRMAQHSNRAFPWPAIVSAVGVVAVILGGYSTLIAAPISSATAVNSGRIESVIRDQIGSAYNDGKLEAQNSAQAAEIADLRARIEELEAFEANAQFIHGQREELGKRVEDIDNLGSRKWNARKE